MQAALADNHEESGPGRRLAAERDSAVCLLHSRTNHIHNAFQLQNTNYSVKSNIQNTFINYFGCEEQNAKYKIQFGKVIIILITFYSQGKFAVQLPSTVKTFSYSSNHNPDIPIDIIQLVVLVDWQDKWLQHIGHFKNLSTDC